MKSSLPVKEDFYSHSEKLFEIKISGEYHDLCVQSDTLLLTDVLTALGICVLK